MKQFKSRCPQIMVVDDDPDSLAILGRYVRREGLIVVEACSGAECLRQARECPPDVIVLDLMMPEMDGFAVCRALKTNAATAEIPVIMLTARDDIDARAEGMELGISEFITKPVVRQELAERLRAQLDMLNTSRANFATLGQLNRHAPAGSRKT